MRKKSFILLMVFMATLLTPSALGAAGLNISAVLSPQIKLVKEGQLIDTTSNTPITYNGKTYVPLQVVSQAMGYQAEWDGKNQTIHLSPADDQYPLVSLPDIQLISVEPKYDLITSLDGKTWLGSINLNFVHQNDKELSRQPVLVVEMVNKDKTVLTSTTTLLNKSLGTQKGYTLGDHIRLPYSIKMSREEVIKQMQADYYYRIKLK